MTTAPLGSTPFGFGTPVAAPIPATKGPALSRFINPGSGDYQATSLVGQFDEMPTTRQRVVLVARTILGSSSARPNLGIAVPKKLDSSGYARIRAAIRYAFYRMVEVEKIIAINSIDLEVTSNGRVQWTMDWTDLTALTPEDSAQHYRGTF